MSLNLPELASGSWDPKLCHSLKRLSPFCKDRMLLWQGILAVCLSPSWWNPSIATLEVLLQLWFLGIQIAAQLISVLFYEWFMEAWRTLRTQHILCFPNVGVMRGALFLPVGTWKTWWAFLAGLNVSERGAKAPAEQAEVQMCVSFDFHWEWQKKIFWLDVTVQFLVSTKRMLSQWSEMPWLNLHQFPSSY